MPSGISHTLFSIIILLCAFIAAGCKKQNELHGQFTVLAYNVAGLPDIVSGSSPELYTSSIGKLINEYNIVHLQEDFCYHDSLLSHNTHPYRTETTGCVPGGDGLNTFSDYPIHDVLRFPWTDCTGADCLTPKGFSYSRIEIEPGFFIHCYNAHCNAGGSAESLAARRKNIEQLCNYIEAHSHEQAALVFGDFNCRYTRSGDSIRALLDLGFTDAWVQLIRNNQLPENNNSSLTNCSFPRTKPDCEIVDKIFYRSSSTIKLTATGYQLDDARFYYQGNDTLELSDHWPVFGTFRYRISN